MIKKYAPIVALGVSVLLVSAACASTTVQEGAVQPTGGEAPATTAPADGGTDAATSSGAEVVDVTLSEFAIELSQTEFEAGVEYVFRVTNSGVVAHELMLIPPVEDASSMDMEALDEMAVAVFTADDLTPGASIEQTVIFSEPGAGGLEAACYVPGHYEAGMVQEITVTG
jgi:uncharacterized cupredoxin-like copper-binding protein